ncbi:hypothetical protein [Nitratireductor thuwali]|uniref:KTSC domain-containing protein n=1 Tax=Nitratireductor thuwali TaxID=2267699 RepID=A0ABY5MFH6_9HYPH|nr:hypothetical protein NTH_01232 [Nitratireductor thuwali]
MRLLLACLALFLSTAASSAEKFEISIFKKNYRLSAFYAFDAAPETCGEAAIIFRACGRTFYACGREAAQAMERAAMGSYSVRAVSRPGSPQLC